MPTIFTPSTYNGILPGYWRDEQSDLPAAVEAFIAHCAGEGPEPSQSQLAKVCAYIRYWVHAPCWEANLADNEEMLEELRELQRRAATLASTESIRRWIEEALALGIDPF
jgi:hypothetical protein